MQLSVAWQAMAERGDILLGTSSAYIAVIFGGGYLIRFVLAATGTMDPPTTADERGPNAEQRKPLPPVSGSACSSAGSSAPSS